MDNKNTHGIMEICTTHGKRIVRRQSRNLQYKKKKKEKKMMQTFDTNKFHACYFTLQMQKWIREVR